ncbi:hypothetical protein BXZ70DRAFT_748134 [Cristinia sonorae]|uniref:DUF6534 domain-containing protein n=1 Tax=Cristinia sonorae TaxID=1940300 RepID=A0A8K0XJQ8_9AGAR|nr:hypothetical protein BXZ70DRAFT_748134 [Cristinia sonorae]
MVSEVESRLGALVVEGCLTLMLYGVLTVQAYVFMLSCQKDSVFTKTIAFAVWTLESLVSAFMVHALYHYTMEIFGHPDLIDNMVWSAPSLYTADRIVVTLVQGYCVWRIWQLSAKSFSTIVPALLWIGRTAISFTILAFLWKFPTWTKIHQDHLTRQVIISCLSVGLASDIAVMAYMIHFLKRDQTGFKGTDHVIRAMISSTVNSGAGVVAASIGLLATYLSAKASLAFVGFITISSVSYANMFFGLYVPVPFPLVLDIPSSHIP